MTLVVGQRIAYICLNSLNILIHGLGFFLLLVLYKKGHKTSQRLYLLNLSFSELLQNFFRLLIHSIILHRLLHSLRGIGKIGHCIVYVTNTGVYYQCFFSVCLLTGDRLLSMRTGYGKDWSLRRRINIIRLSWALNIMASVGIFFYMYFFRIENNTAYSIDNIITIYIPTSLFIAFLVFAVFTYTIMFYKFFASNQIIHQKSTSVLETFRQSKFFISVIIVSTFLFLMVIPGLVATVMIIGGNPPHPMFVIYLNISVTLNDTTDGLIYVFLQPDVKRLFKEKLSSVFTRNNTYVVNQRSTSGENSFAQNIRANLLRGWRNEAARPVSIIKFNDHGKDESEQQRLTSFGINVPPTGTHDTRCKSRLINEIEEETRCKSCLNESELDSPVDTVETDTDVSCSFRTIEEGNYSVMTTLTILSQQSDDVSTNPTFNTFKKNRYKQSRKS